MEAIIQCDMCGNQFKIEKLRKRQYSKLIVHYFSCPSCGYNYPVQLEDTLQKRYNTRIRILRDEIAARVRLEKPISQAKLRQLNRLIEDSKEHQSTLRDIYKDAVTAQLNSGFNETNS